MISKNLVNFLFYLVIAIIYTGGLTHFFCYTVFPGQDLLGNALSQLKFLTIWNYVTQAAYFLLGTLNALQHFFTKKPKDTVLNRLCNQIYLSLVFPVGVVSRNVIFWN
jgi:hypothetical protein